MEIIDSQLNGVLLIKPDVFKDARGYFFESFSQLKYEQYGIDSLFVQDNISKSSKNTIRGLHYQVGEYAQGKLCQVIKGKVFDVAVDIRFGSPTFGKHFIAELSEENHFQIWIPPGFAHGFAVFEDGTIFHYKCTNYYDKNSERAIIYNDSDLNINWNIQNPIVSEKDLNAKKFKEIEKDFNY